MSSVFQTLKDASNFTTLVKALETAGLDEVLSGDGPYTLLAPDDDAFNELDEKVLVKLMEDGERLGKVLKYHVLAGTYKAADLDTIERATTLEGDDVVFELKDGLRADEAPIRETDMEVANGVIHTLSKVMLPEKYLY